MNSAILSDKNIRKALQVGVNVEEIKQKIDNKAPDLYLPFITDQISGKLPPKPSYDVSSANKILSDLGWKLNKIKLSRKKKQRN